MNGGHCSDDGFEYFRNWLISRGRETFERALLDPDSLADEVLTLDDQNGPSAEFESYGYAAGDAYLAATGMELVARKNTSIESPTDEAELSDAPEVLEQRLPRLWRKYGEYKLHFDERVDKVTEELMVKEGEGVDVPGLGTVHIGDTIMHRKFGSGTIKTLARRQPIIAVVSFAGVDHPMMVDATLFSLS